MPVAPVHVHTPPPGAVAPYAPPQQQPYSTPPPQYSTPPQRSHDPAASAPSTEHALRAARGSRTWIFVVIAIVVLGGIVGAALALFA